MIYRNGFGYLRQIPDGQFADGLGDYGEGHSRWIWKSAGDSAISRSPGSPRRKTAPEGSSSIAGADLDAESRSARPTRGRQLRLFSFHHPRPLRLRQRHRLRPNRAAK